MGANICEVGKKDKHKWLLRSYHCVFPVGYLQYYNRYSIKIGSKTLALERQSSEKTK